MKRKASPIPPTDRKKLLPSPVLPASTPRNPIAINPLLKKSGAHADKRRRAIHARTTQELLQSKQQRLKGDVDE